MRLKHYFSRQRYALLSAIIIGLGIQCFAHAGFAVNQQSKDTKAVYAANASDEVPKFVTQKKAIQLAEQAHDIQIIIAYNIDLGQSKHLSQLPAKLFYYYNPYTSRISAALTKKDAIALAHDPRTEFFAIKGETLSKTISRWLQYNQDNPYQLYWDSDYDYKLQYSYTFTGELLTPNGVLDQLLKSFAHGDYAFTAEKTPNQVLIVHDRRFHEQNLIGF